SFLFFTPASATELCSLALHDALPICAVDHVARHRGVDLTGQLDEAGPRSVLRRFPGQIERIERDAVAAEAGTGIERHEAERLGLDRKSTRLNSSHQIISYAVFCWKKK